MEHEQSVQHRQPGVWHKRVGKLGKEKTLLSQDRLTGEVRATEGVYTDLRQYVQSEAKRYWDTRESKLTGRRRSRFDEHTLVMLSQLLGYQGQRLLDAYERLTVQRISLSSVKRILKDVDLSRYELQIARGLEDNEP